MTQQVEYLTSSMSKLGTYSDGPSQTRYTKLWHLILDDVHPGFEDDPLHATHRLDSERMRSLWIRKQVHLLIERIPEQGLAEAYESLRDIYEFHSTQPEESWVPRTEDEVWVYPIESHQRPEFPVLED